MALSTTHSVILKWKSTMWNFINILLRLVWIFSKQIIKSLNYLHWVKLELSIILLIIVSRIILLTIPRWDLDGINKLHFVILRNVDLWYFMLMKPFVIKFKSSYTPYSFLFSKKLNGRLEGLETRQKRRYITG